MGQLSPDGQWRWDGWRWVPAAPVIGQPSPDGQWRWDGWRWVPAGAPAAPRRPAPRVPTIWTRRLQIVLLIVAGVGLVQTLIGAALLPSVWARLEATIVAQWQAQGIPGSEISSLQQSFSAYLWITLVIEVLFAIGFCTLQVVGTLRRWVWWYWVQFAFCCLALVSLFLIPIDLLNPLYRSLPTLPLGIVGDVISIGTGICMLVAAAKIGPWAMTRDPARFRAPQGRP